MMSSVSLDLGMGVDLGLDTILGLARSWQGMGLSLGMGAGTDGGAYKTNLLIAP